MIRLLAKESVNPNIHCQGYSPLGVAAMNGTVGPKLPTLWCGVQSVDSNDSWPQALPNA
jgi:hypothetical protein